ncbi:endonuclease/exonuclease/phosphatase family protein [Streptomyces sp. NPDC012888]|uniref:endonuclease/exonuclease/phosphatase family protein n=1 Tax=Streptomyces sp. NPDC012888 TaxID=3364855 RepID=UPI0036765EFD
MRLLVGVGVVVGCVLFVGSSAPRGELFDGSGSVVAGRVMTWNICNPCDVGNGERAAEIAAHAPEVVGLQEACVRDVEEIRQRLRAAYGLVYHVEYGTVLRNWNRCGGLPWRPGAYGQAVLSAAPMTGVVVEEYPDGGSEDRGYMAVTTVVGGRPVRVFNTHLAERRQEAVRAQQAGVLGAAVARHDRVIVLGDLNARPTASELDVLLGPHAGGRCGAGACEPTTDWETKFDYVLLRGVVPLGQRVVPTAYSDHHLLYADVDAG